MFLRILCALYAQNIVSSTFLDTALALAIATFFHRRFRGFAAQKHPATHKKTLLGIGSPTCFRRSIRLIWIDMVEYG